MYNLPVLGSGLPDVANALMQKRMQEQEMQQRDAQLEMQQRRLGLEEQRYGQEQQAQLDENERQWLSNAVQVLHGAGPDPTVFERMKAQILAHPAAQSILPRMGITPDQITPQSVDEVAQQVQIQTGIAQRQESVGTLYPIEGPQGAQYATAQQAVGQTPYRAPPQGATGTWSQPVEVTGPDGKPQLIQTHSVTGETRPVKGYRPKIPPSRQGITPKDATVAKNKINTVKLARQQLADIRRAFEPLKDSISAGPFGQGRAPTPEGNAFDRAVDRMRSTLTALTRVPGVGAMSDYETRLDQAKFPNRGDYEKTTQESIDALDAMLNAVETGYTDLLSGDEPEQEAQTGGWSIEPAP
jgi:hypothetical protein